MQSTESYFKGDELAISTFNRKYALPKGRRLEYPEEAVRRVIRPLLEFEPSKKIGETWLETWMNGYWRFGGSIFTIGNKENPKQSTANCTTTIVEDDTLEAIFKAAYEVAKCAAYRQGIGIDISALRPRGSKLRNSAKTSDGSIHWLDFISVLANYVGQNARKPALLGSLNILHPDILEFISVKDDLKKLTNMNISVQIPNTFMSAAMNGRSVSLKFNGKIYKVVKAMDLLKLIADHAYNFGEPGIQFISLMKQHSMQEAVGFPICSSNACCIPDYIHILTKDGLLTVKELMNKTDIQVRTDEGPATVEEIIKQADKLVLRLYTEEGVELDATYDHKIKTTLGMKQMQDLKPKDKVIIPAPPTDFVMDKEERDIGFFIGYVLENGYLHKSKKTIWIFTPKEDIQTQALLLNFIKKHTNKVDTYQRPDTVQTTIFDSAFYKQCEDWGITLKAKTKKTIPDFVLHNPSRIAGCIASSLHSSGVINIKRKNITISSSSLTMAKQLQQMLLYFGIKSVLYRNRRQPLRVIIPNLLKLPQLYKVKQPHTIQIPSDFVAVFNDLIGAIDGSSQQQLLDNVAAATRSLAPKAYLHVAKLEKLGVMPVCDLVNSTTRTFTANGIVVSNSEKPLPKNGVCNLCSINLGAMSINNWEHHLDTIVPSIVRFMDDVTSYELAYNKSPLPEQKRVVTNLREIGVGVTNVHEWLLKHNVPYGSNKGNHMLEEVISYISKLVWIESEKLAKERGSFPAFNSKKLQSSKFYQHMCKEVGEPEGLRFAANMSIAPAGSISLILPGYVSQGIEPAIGFAYWRKTRIENKDYDHYFILTNPLKQALLQKIDNDYEYNFINDLNYSTLDNDGEIGSVVKNIVRKYGMDKVYKGSHDVAVEDKLDLLGRIQPWVDAGISTTFNLPKDFPSYTLPTFICNAWQKNIKCLSIYRIGSRDDILTFTPPKKIKKDDIGNRPTDITPTFAPKRPESLPCDIHKPIVKGQKYVVLVGLLNNKPYEVFAGKIDNIDIPTTAKTGTIVKRKSRTYDLHIEMDRIHKVIPDLAHTFMNPEHGDLTRSVSRELRHGIPVYFIVDGLKKSDDDVTAFSKVLARVLSKYNGHVPVFAQKQHVCPICNTPLTVEGGCEHCLKCGFSKCD